MARSAAVSAIAFLVFADPTIAAATATHAGRPVAALIGQPSIDPSAQQLVVELETRGSAEPYAIPAWTPDIRPNLWRPGPYGAWDLDAPHRRSAMRFSVSAAFMDNSAARLDATPLRAGARLAA